MIEPFSAQYAAVYEAIYGDKDAASECAALLDLAHRFSARPITRVLDLGCGTGRHLGVLAGLGMKVTGVDRSPTMLARARERFEANACIELLEADLRDFRVSCAFDCAMMNFNVLGYLASNDDLSRALACVRASLVVGGVFVADFWNGPAVVSDPPKTLERSIKDASGKAFLRRSSGVVNQARNTLTITIAITAEDGATAVNFEEQHEMRYFFETDLEQAFDAHGLRLMALTGFPNVDVPASDSAWLAALAAVAV